MHQPCFSHESPILHPCYPIHHVVIRSNALPQSTASSSFSTSRDQWIRKCQSSHSNHNRLPEAANGGLHWSMTQPICWTSLTSTSLEISCLDLQKSENHKIRQPEFWLQREATNDKIALHTSVSYSKWHRARSSPVLQPSKDRVELSRHLNDLISKSLDGCRVHCSRFASGLAEGDSCDDKSLRISRRWSRSYSC
jgi:hypothetical protein